MEIYELSESLMLVTADLRAEVVARELIEEGISTLQNTLIVPEGPFRRSFSREVTALSEENNFENETAYIKLNTLREGVVDMLPPGIVNQSVISRDERTVEIMVEEAEIHEKEFQNARQFFLPVDIEFGRQRIALEQFEHHSIADTYAYYNHELYSYLWPDLKLELSPSQKATLLELTMNVHHSAGNFHECAFYMEKILGQEIEIRTGTEAGIVHDEIENLPELGLGLLGVNWIPFETYEDDACIKIIVGPVPIDEMALFRHHEPIGKNYRILEFLCELLLPVEISWRMVLVPREGYFQINRGRETAVLGYSTVLG